MKLKDSDWQGNFGYWQKSFIHNNLMMIGYSAWQGFLQHGRGVVVCDVDRTAIAPSNTGLEVTQFKSQFIAEQELISSIQAFSLDQELITVLVQAVGCARFVVAVRALGRALRPENPRIRSRQSASKTA